MESAAVAWDDAVREYIERLAVAISQLGMQRAAARVLAVLLVADEDSLSAGELAERLGTSPPTVSVAVRQLEQVGLVTRTRRPGERRDRFAGADLAYATLLSRNRLLEAWRDVVGDGVELIGTRSMGGPRLQQTYDFLTFAIDQMPKTLALWLEQQEGRRPHIRKKH